MFDRSAVGQLSSFSSRTKWQQLPAGVLVPALTARDEAIYWSEIAIFAYSACIRHPVMGVPVRILL